MKQWILMNPTLWSSLLCLTDAASSTIICIVFFLVISFPSFVLFIYSYHLTRFVSFSVYLCFFFVAYCIYTIKIKLNFVSLCLCYVYFICTVLPAYNVIGQIAWPKLAKSTHSTLQIWLNQFLLQLSSQSTAPNKESHLSLFRSFEHPFVAQFLL